MSQYEQLFGVRAVFAPRVKILRESLGMNRSQFSEHVGASMNSCAIWERGECVPNAYLLASLREVTGVNLNWLLTGSGEMIEGRDDE